MAHLGVQVLQVVGLHAVLQVLSKVGLVLLGVLLLRSVFVLGGRAGVRGERVRGGGVRPPVPPPATIRWLVAVAAAPPLFPHCSPDRMHSNRN